MAKAIVTKITNVAPEAAKPAIFNPLIGFDEKETISNVRNVLALIAGASENIEGGDFNCDGMQPASPAKAVALIAHVCLCALGTVEGGAA